MRIKKETFMRKMKKISIILVICLIMEIFAVNAFADDNAGLQAGYYLNGYLSARKVRN